MSGWIVRALSTVKYSESVNEREGTAFHHHSSDSTTFLEGVDCAFLAPKLPSVVPAGPALVLTGETLFTDQHLTTLFNIVHRPTPYHIFSGGRKGVWLRLAVDLFLSTG